MTSHMKQLLLTFSENTSLHGVSRITNQRYSPWIRLAWISLFLLMVGTFLRLFAGTWINYFTYPTVTNVEYRTTDSIAFPSITICNSNAARYSAIVRDNDALYAFTKSARAKGNLPEPELPVDESAIDFVNVTYRVAHQPEDMYLECAFDSQHQTPCNVSKEVTCTAAANAFCHTFNSHQSIKSYGQKVSTRPGGNYGLYLLINIEEYDHVFTVTNASGIQVLVHEPHVLPNVKENGFAVSAGSETLVAVKKTVVKRLPEPYAKSPNLCENTYSSGYQNALKYFSHYSLSACLQECRIDNQLSWCGCSDHLYGGDNYTVCSYIQFINCSLPARAHYDADPSIEASCGCLPECEETLHDATVSSSVINNHIKQKLVESSNVSRLNIQNFDKNILSLKIFFGEMRFTLIEQQSLYTAASLFGELGGQLGLCLGASLLTIAELMQLLVELCPYFHKGSVKQNTVGDKDVPSEPDENTHHM